MMTDFLRCSLFFFFVISSPVFCETWNFSAGRVTSMLVEGRRRTILEGSSKVTSETLVVEAETLTMRGKEYEFIEGRGNVSLVDSERNISVQADRFSYDRDAGLMQFRGQVTLEDPGESVVVRCESLEFREEDERTLMQIAVRLFKDDMICRGEFAIYWREDSILEVFGNPVIWKKNDQYRSERIRVNLKTEEIILEGDVSGALVTEENDG